MGVDEERVEEEKEKGKGGESGGEEGGRGRFYEAGKLKCEEHKRNRSGKTERRQETVLGGAKGN